MVRASGERYASVESAPARAESPPGRGIAGWLRGASALTVLGLLFVAGDLAERLVIAPLARRSSARREAVLSGWARWLAGSVLAVLRRVAGARFRLEADLPPDPGVLILMNHQSLIDIPVAFKCLKHGYPLIVTRKRYGRGIPLVSHMLRLYGHPLVEPGRSSREEIEAIARVAAASERPILVFPEGHRTRDGEIRRFKKAGLVTILRRRRWDVYAVVIDGLQSCGRLGDFVHNISGVRVRATAEGPFPSPADEEELDHFLDEMRQRMCDRLSEIRGSSS